MPDISSSQVLLQELGAVFRHLRYIHLVARVISLQLLGLASGIEECLCIGSANSFIQTGRLKEQPGGCRVSDVEDRIEGRHHGDPTKHYRAERLKRRSLAQLQRLCYRVTLAPLPTAALAIIFSGQGQLHR
jgi:hypothetical protein